MEKMEIEHGPAEEEKKVAMEEEKAEVRTEDMKADKDTHNDEYLIRATSELIDERTKWRTSFSSYSLCDLNSFLTEMKVMKKNSVSDAIIIVGKLKSTGVKILIKLSLRHGNLLDNSLKVERSIYSEIIPSLQINNTPFIMDCLGSEMCELNWIDSLDIYPDLAEQINLIFEKNKEKGIPSYESIWLTFLTFSPGEFLEHWFRRKQSLEDLLSVLFQILHTLKCFRNIYMNHNDLHVQNIFVETEPIPRIMFFKTSSGHVLRLKTNVIVKIYDFDRASIYHPAVPRNLALEFDLCLLAGQCNFPFIQHDTYAILSMIFSKAMDRSIDEPVWQELYSKWYRSVIRIDWLKQIINRTTPVSLQYFYNPGDANMKNIDFVLDRLVTASWSNSPFSFVPVNTLESVPANIVFSLPTKKEIVYTKWSWNDAPKILTPEQAIEKAEAFNTKTISYVLDHWHYEMKLLNYTPPTREVIAAQVAGMLADRNIDTRCTYAYIMVYTFMCYPMLHKYSPDLLNFLLSPAGFDIYNDIFSYLKTFPVSLPKI